MVISPAPVLLIGAVKSTVFLELVLGVYLPDIYPCISGSPQPQGGLEAGTWDHVLATIYFLNN